MVTEFSYVVTAAGRAGILGGVQRPWPPEDQRLGCPGRRPCLLPLCCRSPAAAPLGRVAERSALCVSLRLSCCRQGGILSLREARAQSL